MRLVICAPELAILSGTLAYMADADVTDEL